VASFDNFSRNFGGGVFKQPKQCPNIVTALLLRVMVWLIDSPHVLVHLDVHVVESSVGGLVFAGVLLLLLLLGLR